MPSRAQWIAPTIGGLVILGTAIVCPASFAQAQIIPDSTLGQESSQITPNVDVQDAPATLIEGGRIRGAHLFHSFSDFNVGNGQRVYFDNPAGILNIFSRVTGNSGSNILGTLGVDGMANLYLLNPNGIVFGPNARLDVAGSFVASTANRLVFDDGQFFSVVAPNQPPLLQINVTPGLQYGNNLNAMIRNQGNLQVGQNLTLGAQRLELAGSLEAGRDITLQGWSRQLSNADYTVGGYLFTQDLSGQGIDLLIPHENMILANGDVRFTQNYVGESLHILAGGQVNGAAGANNIAITGTSGGSVIRQIATGTGGIQNVTVTASDQPTVDIRSGMDWSQLAGGLPGNSNTSGAAVTFGIVTGDSIALRNITNNGGDIALWAAGDIAANNLNTSVSIVSSTGEDVQGADGGAISVSAGNNIQLGSVSSLSETISKASSTNNDTLSAAISGDVAGGNGGDIFLIAEQGINVGSIDSLSGSGSFSLLYPDTDIRTDTISGDVIGGDGGNVTLAAGQGDINVGSIDSFSDSISRSQSYIYATSGQVTGGHGGDVALVAGGDINIHAQVASSSGSVSDAVAEFPNFPLIPTSDNVIGGDGGNIVLNADQNINVGSVNSFSTSQSRAASFGPSDSRNSTGGNGGNIYINAGQNITIDALNSFSASTSDFGNGGNFDPANPNDVIGGNGGNIELLSGQNINIGSLINSKSNSNAYLYFGNIVGGNGGDISLVAEASINVSGSRIFGAIDSSSQSFAILFGDITGGNGGDISLVAKRKTINVGDSINLSSSSSAQGSVTGGSGGTLTLVAHQDIRLNSVDSYSFTSSAESEIFPEFSGNAVGGNGGAIALTAQIGSIIVFAQADRFSGELINPNFRSFSAATGGESGPGGSIVLEAATQISADNLVVELLTLSSSAQSGNVQITGLGETFNLLNTAVIASKTIEIENPLGFGEPIRIPVGETGQSGNIDISGNGNLTITNSFFISETNGTDPAGNVTISTPGSIIFNDSLISTSTIDSGRAGSVTFNAQNLTIQDSDIITDTFGSGDAGDIKFNISNVLDINNSFVGASTGTGSTGNGGDITIDPALTLIRNGGWIAVDSAGQGQGGNIFLFSNNLFLDLGAITAETLTSNGGNIEVNIQNLMMMENFSFISTSAGTAQAGGNGGNITINIPDGFLIAPMGADSDIIAQAFEGSGGNINITARGIYGFIEQPAVFGNGMNDIDASSELGQNGTITINSLLIDPSQSINELPTDLLDVSGLAEQSLCEAGRGSEFVVTGRGGLPSSPNDALNSTTTWEDWSVDMSEPRVGATPRGLSSESLEAQPGTVTSERAIVEAQGWIRAEDGRVALVADAATVVPNNHQSAVQNCRQLRQVVLNEDLSLEMK